MHKIQAESVIIGCIGLFVRVSVHKFMTMYSVQIVPHC